MLSKITSDLPRINNRTTTFVFLMLALLFVSGCQKKNIETLTVRAKVVSLTEDSENRSGKVRNNVNEQVNLAKMEILTPQDRKGEVIWVYQLVHKLSDTGPPLKNGDTLEFDIDSNLIGEEALAEMDDLLGMQIVPR